MKICIVGDVHWSQYSSILRKRGCKYSYRLDNLVTSVNWVEELAASTCCDEIVYLGDFFDRAEMNAEEISALSSISWEKSIPHTFLVGNHEMGTSNLQFNSANIFGIENNFYVIDTPSQVLKNSCLLVFIPYILEENRKALVDYIKHVDGANRVIIFSHNDIKDFQMGQFISKAGFSINEIEMCCDTYFNGHLHNGGKVSDKIINVGNLTGQNFSEDAFKYGHSVVILDTDDMSKAVYENPYALNFIKLDFSYPHNNIEYINETSFKIPHNSIATIKCEESDYQYLRDRFNPKFEHKLVPKCCNIVESRFIINPTQNNTTQIQSEHITVDHLTRFKEYMIETLGNTDVLQAELQEVCK